MNSTNDKFSGETVMKEIKIDKCPYCGGEELIETRAEAYAGVALNPVYKRRLRGVALFATVCRDCGSVVRMYCSNPEKLYPKKERKE